MCLMIYTKFIELCNHHHNSVLKHIIVPNRSVLRLAVDSQSGHILYFLLVWKIHKIEYYDISSFVFGFSKLAYLEYLFIF
jgi:hypothetical protein